MPSARNNGSARSRTSPPTQRPAPASVSSRRGLETVCRCITAIFGGYAATNGCIALTGEGAARLGMPAAEAVSAAVLLGLPLYTGLVIWVFGSARWRRACAGVILLAAATTLGSVLL